MNEKKYIVRTVDMMPKTLFTGTFEMCNEYCEENNWQYKSGYVFAIEIVPYSKH